MPRMLAVAALAVSWLGLSGVSPPAPAPAASAITLLGAGIAVSDLGRAQRFYVAGLGLTEVRRLTFGETTEVIYSLSEVPRPPMLFVLARKGSAPVTVGAPRLDKIVLSVGDAKALAARLTAAGYAPTEVKANSVNHANGFWVKDPDGNAFEVTETPRPAS